MRRIRHVRKPALPSGLTPSHPLLRARHKEELLVLLALLAVVALLFLFALFWAGQNGLALFSPTATPTATSSLRPTATADFRATQIALLLTGTPDAAEATATALAAAQKTQTVRPTRNLPSTDVVDIEIPPGVTNVAYLPNISGNATVIPAATTAIVLLPDINSGGNPPIETPAVTPAATSGVTPISTPVPSDTAVPTATLPPPETLPPDTATLPATSPATALAETPTPTNPPEPTETPTETPPLPTPTPTISVYATATATFTPIYARSGLSARSRPAGAPMRLGPSSVYTQTRTIAGDTNFNIEGRDSSGNWMLVCCQDGERGWVRFAHLSLLANDDANAPENIDENNVRWLPILAPAAVLTPLPQITPVAPNDYPMVWYNQNSRTGLPAIPRAPLVNGWPNVGQTAAQILSPVVVSGRSVMVGSADQHLYSFDRDNGNQRWRLLVGGNVRVGMAVQDSIIYAADESGRLISVLDSGNDASIRWQTTLPGAPSMGLNLFEDKLLINIDSGSYELAVLRRDDGQLLSRFNAGDTPLQRPTVGNQLIYLAGANVWALDVNNPQIDTVWDRADLDSISAPPVFVQPGERALAELFVATETGTIYSLDASTGATMWSFPGGERISALSVDASRVYAAGNGFVKAIRRGDVQQQWRTAVNGDVQGAPFFNGVQVMVVANSGAIQFLNAETGALEQSTFVGVSATNAPAVSGDWLFIPSSDNTIRAFRSQ